MAFLTDFLILVTALLSCALCDTNYRLNTRVIPSEYQITITPYFDTGNDQAFTFDGEVTIKVATADSGINQIKLHSEDLIFGPQNITVRNGNEIIPLKDTNPLEFNDTYSFAYINLGTYLLPNVEYVVNIMYKGPIRNDLFGFYRTYYMEKGQIKWLAATQMALVHARKVFPCFDEPQLKATFILAIDRPENYAPTLTNTKLQNTTILNNGYIRERFFPTPVMSTYLVAFLVSELENGGHIDTGDREFGVWVRPEATNQSDYAFNFGKRVVAELGNYVGIDYYSVDSNLNLNHVALPEFIWSAVENWGLIKYREALIMYDPSESTPFYKYRVAQLVAHETAHMWFGNLVTCHWWSDTWLNEGFPTYLQDLITSILEPELGAADVQVTSSSYQAYSADETENPPALTNIDVNSPEEINGHFGTISYQKGGTVIRMIHHWIGDEAFRNGLYHYLNVGRLGSVNPSMLYTGLDTGVSFTNSLEAYPGYTVAGLMSAWVSQPGHPVLQVELDPISGAVILTQNRFYANSSHQSNELYPIPITYTTQSEANFENTKPTFIMADRTHSFGNFSRDDWIIFNLQETGFYRVNYDKRLWSFLGDTLRGPNRTIIHYLNRAKIVNDIFALALAEHMSFELAFDVLEFLVEETEYSVWVPALSGFNNLRNILQGTAEADQLEIFALRLLEKVIEDLGFDERASDSFVTLRNRMQITDFACKLGHEGCVEHAVSTFRSFRDMGTPIAPSLRPVVYCQGLKYGTPEDYDFMEQLKITTNVVNDALIIETALGCTQHKEKFQSFLKQIVFSDSSLQAQYISMPLTSILSDPDGFQVAFEFLKRHYTTLSTKISMKTILSYFPFSATCASDLTEFAAWLEICTVCESDEVEAAQMAIQLAKTRRDWTQEHLSDIVDPLKQKNSARSRRNRESHRMEEKVL